MRRLSRGPCGRRPGGDQSEPDGGDGPGARPQPARVAAGRIINYESTIGPIVANKCVSCHQPTIVGTDTTAAAGNLDLTAVPDTTMEDRIFPRGYINLSGESMSMQNQEVTPAFPRRSRLIDYVLGLGSRAGMGSHPTAPALTERERADFNLWVLLGAQYK